MSLELRKGKILCVLPEKSIKVLQRLLTLINDILRLSQLDSVEECVDTEPVDLYEMALNCQDMLEMQANKHQVVVRVKGKSEVVRQIAG